MTRRDLLRDLFATPGAAGAGPADGRVGRALPAAFVLLGVLLCLSPWGLWDPDEGRYADVARLMLERHDFVTPRINGVVMLDKPPLVYWVTAASMAVWGVNERGARFGQTLFALGILAIAFEVAWVLYRDRRALIAALILGSSVGFFVAGHFLTHDLGLSFFVALTLLCFLKGWRAGAGDAVATGPGAGNGPATRWYLGMFAAAAGGVLTKGPVAVVLAGLTGMTFIALVGGWRRLRGIPWVRGTLLFLAISVPWFIAVSIANPEFPEYFFIHEHLTRFATTVHHRQGPLYYYLVVGAGGLLPWTPLLALRAARGPRRLAALAGALRSETTAFLFAWIMPALAFFSVSQSKLPAYILPIFPALAIAVAVVLDANLRGRARRGVLFLAPLVAPLLLLAAAAVYAHGHAREWSSVPGGMQVWPIFAAVAALGVAAQTAGWLLDRRGRTMLGLATAAACWAVAWFILMAAAGRAGTLNEASHLARVLRREGADAGAVYNYRCYLRGIPFYLRHTIRLVQPSEDDIELARTKHPDPAVFPGRDELVAALRGDTRVFVVLPTRYLDGLSADAGGPLTVLERTARYVLVSNQGEGIPGPRVKPVLH
ncbi:MAG TPA: phospholipid carrier-dependent glycosyltransferase [Patescibacteria group bacterium]|nr:phospholipid carrier-dependent glycosyltransferase [Patescibacteria group bacterium]